MTLLKAFLTFLKLEKWAYGAKIMWDDNLKLNYFIGMVVEWWVNLTRDAVPYFAKALNLAKF